MKLELAPPQAPTVEHTALCSVDGEPWPCAHVLSETHRRTARRYLVYCGACGQLRNEWASLDITRGLDDQPVYFHDRKRCRPAAARWWNENIEPLTHQAFSSGTGIDDLTRYLYLREGLELAAV